MKHSLGSRGGKVEIEGTVHCDLETARQRTNQAVNPLWLGPSPKEVGPNGVLELGYQPFFIRGSSHLLKYRERFFQIFSRHQVFQNSHELHGHPYAMVCETSTMMTTAPAVKSCSSDKTQQFEHCDIAAIELDRSTVSQFEGFEDRFFPLGETFYHPNADKEDKWSVVGYPQRLARYEVETEPPTFHRSLVEVFGEPTCEDRSKASEVCSINVFPRADGSQVLNGKFDGFSGAPVYAWSASRQDLYYRGLVITGSGGRLRLIRELIVRCFLDAVIEETN